MNVKKMGMGMDELVELSKKYEEAFTKRNKRFYAWTEGGVCTRVAETLESIVGEIKMENPFFQSNLYSGVNFSEARKDGKVYFSKSERYAYFRSGKMPKSSYSAEGVGAVNFFENGFEMIFAPLTNGKIHVHIYGHWGEDENRNHDSIELIDDPNILTREKVIDLVYKGLEKIQGTCFLF